MLILYFSRTDLIISLKEIKSENKKKINKEDGDDDEQEILGKFAIGEILSCERYIFFSTKH